MTDCRGAFCAVGLPDRWRYYFSELLIDV